MLLQGVNYASSASGISNSTGSIFVAQKLLRRAIYGIAIGSNDIMFRETSPKPMSDKAFLDLLISRLKLGLRTLYNLNARKFIVGNAGPGGCIPWEKDLHFLPGGTCARVVNKMARMYNNKLKRLLVELNKDLKGANFVYADIYQILTDLTENYVSYGFENGISACCSTAGPRGGLILCNPLAKVCPDRSKYVFWDPDYQPLLSGMDPRIHTLICPDKL
ncbi:hypothetical protein DVH24_041276 [Malus domestica]|uniref:GDSL esterase/lipase n=1 Tax=Malus domestica TaxID=3750 RepID=A0A498IB09_MALDO|nr:hypothetical protein DVH24_041276 [Malus domestica]